MIVAVAKVYRCNFWMAFFNSKTPKRTSLWSNSKQIRKFWLGKLTKEIRQSLKKNNPDFKTTVTYVDSQGKKRFHGTKSLRSTQNLGLKNHVYVDGPFAFFDTSIILELSLLYATKDIYS